MYTKLVQFAEETIWMINEAVSDTLACTTYETYNSDKPLYNHLSNNNVGLTSPTHDWKLFCIPILNGRIGWFTKIYGTSSLNAGSSWVCIILLINQQENWGKRKKEKKQWIYHPNDLHTPRETRSCWEIKMYILIGPF